MKTRQFFEAHPIFRYEEFTAFMTSKGIERPQSWRQQLSYHHKVGNLAHIRKYLYAVKPTSIKESDFWVDPFLIASKATEDAVLAYHTALELHGMAYTTFDEFEFVTRRMVISFVYSGSRFRSVLIPKSLIKKQEEDYGIDTIKRQGVTVRITNLERTVVDLLDRPDLGGGWEEIWRSFDNIVQLDWGKVVEYVLLLNNATTIAKVGFFMEQRPHHLAPDRKYTEKLLPHIPKQPHYMNRDRRGDAKYIEKWRLMVPLEILNRTWEEPNADNV